MNPDFRGTGEIIVPSHRVFGWTDGTVTETQAVLRERQGRERLENDMPVVCRNFSKLHIEPTIEKSWNDFQKSKGRFDGSFDWSLLDEFVWGKPLLWLPQIIGSCVVSNNLRGWVIKMTQQIALSGEPYEYLGKNEFGPNNFSYYGPYTYGAARKRANMRGGDGLYCEAIQESYIKDGVLPCNTPKLLEILNAVGATRDKDFPEPQSAALYRAFGDWKYLDELKQYAGYTLAECPSVTSADQLWTILSECKPSFQCSMLAIKKVGEHKDGFPIHARNPNDQWAHNMCHHGGFIASNGDRFFRFSNESWGQEHIYNIRFEEVDDWFKRRNITVAAIGQINGPQSAPPIIA